MGKTTVVTASERRALFLSLATMFGAGIPLHRAFELLAEQFESPAAVEVCQGVATRLTHGHSLPASLQEYPEAFTPLQIKLTQVGTATGGLATVLAKLARHEERQGALVARARAALTYPAMVFAGCLAMVVLLPPFLFRNLLEVLVNSGVELPFLTRLVVGLSEIVRSPLLLVGAAGFAMVVIGVRRLLYQKPGLRLWLAERLLGLGPLGRALRTLAVSRFAESLALTVEVGLPLPEGLELSAAAADNPVLERDIGQAVQALLDGEHVAGSLAATGFFPPLVLSAVEVGEETGKLPVTLASTVALCEQELEYRLEVLSAALEPLVTFVLGLVVTVVVLSVLLPITRLMSAL